MKLTVMSQYSTKFSCAKDSFDLINSIKDRSDELNKIHEIITVLMNQYGKGYDHLKTLSIIIENLDNDLKLFNEIK